ncbi:MAG: cytochrome c [Planctomycetes bacterium]|nr:cytochrome c [Planctomycetota bacterium]
MIDKVLNGGIDVAVKHLDKCKDKVVALHTRVGARYWIGMGALIGAVLAGLVAGYLQRDFGKRNLEYQPIPDMSISKAAESQMVFADVDGNSPFADGRTDREPPEGTVYRGQKFYTLAAGEMEKSRPLVNPLRSGTAAEREAAMARGKDLFRFNCQGCHGVDGVGNAPVVQYGVPAPKIADNVVRDRYTDGELFHIITYGIRTMPPHASHVKHDDRWKLILYLRKLQGGN